MDSAWLFGEAAELWDLTCRSSGAKDPCNVNHYVAEVAPSFEIDAMARALAALVVRHPALGCRIDRKQGRWRLSRSVETQPPIAQVMLEKPDGEAYSQAEIENAIGDQVYRPFGHDEHGSSGPLLRALEIIISRRRFFAIVAHHAVLDGLSLSIAVADLQQLYEQALMGPISPARLPLSYLDHAVSLEAWAETKDGRRAAQIWHDLAFRSTRLEIPPAVPLPSLPRAHRLMQRSLTFKELSCLRARCVKTKTKLFHVTLANWCLACHRAGAPSAGLLNVIHHGRDDRRLLNVVGCFVTRVPLMLTLRSLASGIDMVRDIEAACVPLQTATPPLTIGHLPIVIEGSNFNFVNYPSHGPRMGALGQKVRLAHPDWPDDDRQFGNSMCLFGNDLGMSIEFYYRQDQHDISNISKLLDDYVSLLLAWPG